MKFKQIFSTEREYVANMGGGALTLRLKMAQGLRVLVLF